LRRINWNNPIGETDDGGGMMDQFEWGHLAYLLILLVVVAPAILRWNWRGGVILRNTTIWLALAAAIALVYRLFIY
jgi:hypothetical protein